MDLHCRASSDDGFRRVLCAARHIPRSKVHTFRREPLLFALPARNLGVIPERVGIERVSIRDEPELRLDVLERDWLVLLPHFAFTGVFQ